MGSSQLGGKAVGDAGFAAGLTARGRRLYDVRGRCAGPGGYVPAVVGPPRVLGAVLPSVVEGVMSRASLLLRACAIGWAVVVALVRSSAAMGMATTKDKEASHVCTALL